MNTDKERVVRRLLGVKGNPMHYCLGGCDKWLGFRGFCSQKCHNQYYDDLGKM